MVAAEAEGATVVFVVGFVVVVVIIGTVAVVVEVGARSVIVFFDDFAG
jgi:hypothetical protein